MPSRTPAPGLTGLLLLTLLVPPLTAQAARADAEVRRAMSGFMDALNRLDADGMAAFFAPDISAFVPVVQAERVEGKAAVDRIFRAFVERTRPTTARLSLVPEDLEVTSTSTLAVVTFNIRNSGAGVVRRRTFVWQRTGGRWLIRHFHASDLAPPRAPPG